MTVIAPEGLIIRVAAKGEGATADGRYAALAAPGDLLEADGTCEFSAQTPRCDRRGAHVAPASARASDPAAPPSGIAPEPNANGEDTQVENLCYMKATGCQPVLQGAPSLIHARASSVSRISLW